MFYTEPLPRAPKCTANWSQHLQPKFRFCELRTLGTSSILVHSAHAIASASQSTRAPNLVPIVNLFSIVDHADFAIRIGINLSPSGTKVGVGILHTKSTQNFSTSFHPHVGGGEEDGAPAPKGAGGRLPPRGGELMGGGAHLVQQTANRTPRPNSYSFWTTVPASQNSKGSGISWQ